MSPNAIRVSCFALLFSAPALAYTGTRNYVLEDVEIMIDPGEIVVEEVDTDDADQGDTGDTGDIDEGLIECFDDCYSGLDECYEHSGDGLEACDRALSTAYYGGLIDYNTYVTFVQACETGSELGDAVCETLAAQCFSTCF